MKKRLKKFLVTLGAAAMLYGFAPNVNAAVKTSTEANMMSNSVKAVKIEQAPVIDGSLEDRVWDDAPVISDFKQSSPIEGAPVSEDTKVRLVYDNDNIYIAFENFDSEPDKILRRVTERDAMSSSDTVTILLSTYDDNRSAYIFTVNASNVQTDAVLTSGSRGGHMGMGDRSWDAVWDSAVKVDDKGWVAEIAIPFKSLRFSPKDVQNWGVNFSRSIRRKNETASWTAFERDYGFGRIDKAGKLIGLQGIKPGEDNEGRVFEVLPYVMGSREVRNENREKLVFTEADLGVDMKFGITSNMILDATVNPDFGQVEADMENISVSRYEKRFREKRPFFTEGADKFKTSGIEMFYPRRIGTKLSDGSVVPIFAGLKLTGKVNGFEIGFIDALTGSQDYTFSDNMYTEPMTNYSVLRLKKDFSERSNFGFIVTSKDWKEDSSMTNSRAMAFDLSHNFEDNKKGNYNLTFLAAKSFNPGVVGNDFAGILGFSRSSKNWSANIGVGGYGKNFNINKMGYLPRNDLIGGEFGINYTPRYEKKDASELKGLDKLLNSGNTHILRQIRLSTGLQANFNTAGEYEIGSLKTGIDFTFDFPEELWGLGYWRLGFDHRFSQERFYNIDNPAEGMKIYDYNSFSANLSSDYSKPVFVRLNGSIRDFLDYTDEYYGKNKSFGGSLNVIPWSNVSLSAGLSNSYEYFGNGDFDEVKRLVYGRMNLSINKDLFLKFFAQKRLGQVEGHTINALLGYNLNAKSALYLVYNSSNNTGTAFNTYTSIDDQVFYVKFSYLFDKIF